MVAFQRGQIVIDLPPHETILWRGRPVQGLRLGTVEAFYALVDGLFSASLVRLIEQRIAHGDRWSSVLLDVPLLLPLLYFSVGNLVLATMLRRTMYYFVTSERIIIVWRFFGWHVKSIGLDTLVDLRYSERGQGSGTIEFRSPGFYGYLSHSEHWGIPSRSKLELASGVHEAYQIIYKAMSQRPRGDGAGPVLAARFRWQVAFVVGCAVIAFLGAALLGRA